MNNDTHFVSISDIAPLIVESLANGKPVRFSPRGISMLPMLREGKDSVLLSPIKDKLSRYDIPLYQRADGKYVLHRIVEAGESYTCIGDNQFVYEKNVSHDQLIGVVTEFYRGNKRISTASFGYRFYCILWCKSRGFRHFVKRGIGFIKRKVKSLYNC